MLHDRPAAPSGVAQSRPGALADAVSEIVMRRQMLDRMDRQPDGDRASVTPSLRRPAGRDASTSDAVPQPPATLSRRFESLAADAQTLRTDDGNYRMMAEIAGELQRLREEMQSDRSASPFDARFEEMRRAFDQLREMIGGRDDSGRIGDELRNISSSLAGLTEAGADRATLNVMRSELEELRHLFNGGAREETIQAVGDRWQSFENRYAAREEEDVAAKEELKRELERLRESLRSLAREDQVEAVERRWDAFEERYREAPSETAISKAIRDELGGVHAKLETMSDATPMHARWDELEKRLDQDRIVASVQGLSERMGEIEAKLSQLPDSLGVAALEERMRSLAVSLDALARRSEQADVENFMSLEERLDEISRAIVAAVPPPAPAIDMAPIERIEARIAMLTTRVDEMGDEDRIDEFAKRIAELSDRVEELAANPAGVEMSSRIQMLGERFEAAFSDFGAHQVDTAAMEKRIGLLTERFELAIAEIDTSRIDTGAIEERLAALAARLESSAAEPRFDETMIRSLEAQIERLGEHLTRTGTLQDHFEGEIDRRLEAIEQRLEGNREMLIHAAREAAEETARRMQAVGDQRQAEHVVELSENLRSLETLSRESDGRSNQVFEAVHSTLLKIVDRLEQIEAEIVSDHRGAPAAWSVENDPERDETAPSVHAPSDPDVSPADRAREAVAAARTREEVAAPTLDTVDMIDRNEMNRPLEPGTGMPDIGALLERVRAAQRSRAGSAEEPSGEAETRAIARKAAKAAIAETEKLRAPDVEAKFGGVKALMARRRKAILTGVVAVIVALSALPIGKAALDMKGSKRVQAAGDQPSAPAAKTPAGTASVASSGTPTIAAGDPKVEANDARSAAAIVPAAPVPPVSNAAQDKPAVAEVPQSGAAVAPPARPEIATVSKPEAANSAEPAALLAGLRAKLPASATMLPPVPVDIGPQPLQDAAKAGDEKAAFEIALRLMEGRTGSPQPAAALDWFAQAAVKNFAPAQYSLGTLYEKGNGVARDTAAARDWYLLAADNGNVRAMHNLAVLYATGIDGRSQPETAARWFVEAAEHGMRDSQYNLGVLYARGSGVDQDMVQSYKWFSLVADGGDSDAAAKRDEIAKSLTPEQLETAKAAVTSFAPASRNEAANSAEAPLEWQDKKDETSSVDITKAIRNIQAILGRLGYDAGTPDGRMGDRTRLAVSAFQKDHGLKETGEIDGPLIRALLQKKDG